MAHLFSRCTSGRGREEGVPGVPVLMDSPDGRVQKMLEVSEGKTVKVHYTGTLDNGHVFDTSAEREPLEFTVGQGQLIPGFEEAVVGMKTGEEKTVHIPAEKAYGPHRPEMAVQVSRGQFPPDMEPEIGQMLEVKQTDGQPLVVTVTGVEGDQVTLDANHPLAGKDLNFEIRVVEVG